MPEFTPGNLLGSHYQPGGDLDVEQPGALYTTPFLCALSVHETVHTYALEHESDLTELCYALDKLLHYHAVLLSASALSSIAPKGVTPGVVSKRRRRHRKRRSRPCTSNEELPLDTNHIVPAPAVLETLVPYDVKAGIPHDSREQLPVVTYAVPTANKFDALSDDDTAVECENPDNPLLIGQDIAHNMSTSSSSSRSQGDQASHGNSRDYKRLPRLAVEQAVASNGPSGFYGPSTAKRVTVANVFDQLADSPAVSSFLENTEPESISHVEKIVLRSGKGQSSQRSKRMISDEFVTSVSDFMNTNTVVASLESRQAQNVEIPMAITTNRWKTSTLWLPTTDPLGNQLLVRNGSTYIAIKPQHAINTPGLGFRTKPVFDAHDPSGRHLVWGESACGYLQNGWLRVQDQP